MEFFLLISLVSAAHVVKADVTCSDIDTSACVRMHQQQPDLCTSDLGNSACPSFCGLCGTTAGVLTAIPLVNTAATTAPCDDIDSHACALMHSTRPDLCSDESLANAACKRYCGKCPVECYSCSDLVQDIRQCNSITMCNLNEACYQMEVFDFDRSHGFRGGCISKSLCVPHGDGMQIFGRSSSTVHTTCCDTDKCNGETPTTPRPTTTTTTEMTTTFHHGHFTHRPCVDDLSASQCSRALACLFNDIDCRKTCGLCH